MLKSFQEIEELIKIEKPRTIAVAMAEDSEILIALERARSKGLAKAILTGEKEKIKSLLEKTGAEEKNYEIVDTKSEKNSVSEAISLLAYL